MSTNDYRKCAKCGRTRAEDKFVSYHRFPNPGKDNISKALAWAKYCWPNKDWTHASLLSLHTTNKVLCGRHFALSQFYDNKQQKLSKFAVPDSAEVEEFLNKRQNIFKQTHELYHPNPYQQHCQLFTEQSKTPTLQQNNHFEAVTAPHHVVSTQPDCVQAHPEPQSVTPAVEKKTMLNKSSVDTSTFSIEERLVTAVWVHERKHTKNSMSQIKHDFRQRFGRDPPAKNTLLVWERKLFSTGSVHDAPRPGRPVNRHARMEDVKASVRAAPALSLRARALSLRVPRTTLRTILRRDLPHTPPRARETAHLAAAGKQQIKRNVKRKLQSQRELGAGAGAEPRSGYT